MSESNPSTQRSGGRRLDEIRRVEIIPDYVDYPEGAALIKMGNTWVLCAATLEDRVPRWIERAGHGWVTATYNLLPRSTQDRTRRERGGARGRTQEIERLIGRSLRAAVNLPALGERMITVDCDVIQADGGTRTAAVTGGYVAVAIALYRLIARRAVSRQSMRHTVAAVSAGVVQGQVMLDLDYEEDSQADVDLNVAMTEAGQLVEIQGTAEGDPFSRHLLKELIGVAWQGIQELQAAQREAVKQALEQ